MLLPASPSTPASAPWRTQAAKLLGISFRSMRYRMERLEIE
ncbi:helix-turn-helix domain-containing protein, partial [Eikenella corrodens]|nr:helix-turn-helix domain-containing protein [Eikenella corrodens]